MAWCFLGKLKVNNNNNNNGIWREFLWLHLRNSRPDQTLISQRGVWTLGIRSGFLWRKIQSFLSPCSHWLYKSLPVDNGSAPRTSLGGGRDFPRSLLKAPPGRSDYLTICQKGGLQNLWHFWIATVFCHRKEKANHFFQQTTPSVSCTDYYEIAKDHTLGFLCFHSF